ncbi:UDP-N-acetylmuramate dehydrogenase [Wansuia hejianensis]|uniref:UDP-N-acetylmuramate dehydrogenase n=1 Tax=Wansuia hejianensis TaxID=2763667 RepID=UPI0020161F60|nr:UDP-N-acetylmuramate dehydrogenase [Wansuia hejianensis]
MDKNQLIQIFNKEDIGEVFFNEPMKNHTSFKIGGPADVMIVPHNENQIVKAVKLCRENNIDHYIMGNGSNLLVRDGGMRSAVIKINEGFKDIEINGDRIICQSGALLTAVSRRAAEKSLTGMEFANGIPGTIGGAVTMNAGAYGGEMKDVITKVRILDRNNNIKEYTNEEMNFRYRGSRVVDEGLIVLGVEIQLKVGDFEKIREKMKDLTHQRTSKQPLELPSGGSTFKRPTGYYAGKLIMDSGLRGLRYGGAQVSEKHCGFVVNVDNATCKDVLSLISVIQKTVRDNYDVDLEPEIKIIGEDN